MRQASLAILAALLSSAALAQEDDAPQCYDFSGPEAAFDLVGAGAVISTPAFEREDARTDFAVFEDGAAVAVSAGFCTYPSYEMTASFAAPAGESDAWSRMAFLFEVLETTTGCAIAPESRMGALGPAVQALSAGADFQTEDGVPVHQGAAADIYLSLAADSGQVMAIVSCEIHAAGD